MKDNTDILLDRVYNTQVWLMHELEYIKKTGHSSRPTNTKADYIWMSKIAELIITSQKPYMDEIEYNNTVNVCRSIIDLDRQIIKELYKNEDKDKNLNWQLNNEES